MGGARAPEADPLKCSSNSSSTRRVQLLKTLIFAEGVFLADPPNPDKYEKPDKCGEEYIWGYRILSS